MKVCPKCGKQYGDDANFCTADAGRLVAVAAAPAAATADAGLIGGRFELGERIGGGATGDVHRAVDRQGGGQVAVKLIDPALTAQATGAQRIERELKLLERVASPSVARVIASGRHGDRMWVATEWVDQATPLDAALDAGAIEADRASEIALAIGGALVEAAKVGVVHRDLAPKNVLVGASGVKVINFPLPVPGPRVPGVPGFVSPEAIEGKPIDQRSATYSLGAIYYATLTGTPPFSGDAEAVHAAQLTGSVQPPSTKVPLAPEIDSLVGRAMERNPARRYLTLKQFLDDIEKIGKSGNHVEPSPATTQPFGRVGKPKELAGTMLGLGPIPGGGHDPAMNELKTRQMDVQIPAEALREAAALDGPAVPPAPPTLAPTQSAPVQIPTLVTPAVAPPPAAVTAQLPAASAPHPMFAELPRAPSQPVAAPPPAVIPAAIAPPPVAVPVPVAVAPSAPHPAPVAAAPPPAAGSSPWAPPTIAPSAAAPGPMTPAAHAIEAAAPAIGAIAAQAAPPSAPVMPPSASSASNATGSQRVTTKGTPGGKNKPDTRGGKKKGQFRETLWFKKGDLDAVAAEEAARARDGSVQDKADLLPMEERYKDDGSITSSDAERYSLKTGHTSQMPVFPGERGSAGSSVSEGDLIGEMKSGRKVIFIAIAVAVVVIVAIVVLFAT